MVETKPVYKLRNLFRDCIIQYFEENEDVLLSRNDAAEAAEEAYEDLVKSGYIDR